MAEPVVTQQKDGSYKLSWLLPNTYYADRLQELLQEVGLSGNTWPLKSGQARLVCTYESERVLDALFVCFLFTRKMQQFKQLNQTWLHSAEDAP